MAGTLTRDVSLVALLCRTSDRGPEGAAGAEALARALGEHFAVAPRIVGTPGEPRSSGWEQDLRDARGCILEAGGQIDDAFTAGRFPVLLSSDCTIALTTLPAVARHEPGATVLWLDAHGDFNLPETTESGFLGGMCLAGACGAWDPELGVEPFFPAAQVVTCGVRDLDRKEAVLMTTHRITMVERPSQLADVLDSKRVFVHVDCDVLDPSVLPAQFPADGGLSEPGLKTLLGEVAEACDVIGCEVTAFGAPEHAERMADVIAPLLPQAT